uniref:Cadherin, EGF LAG seven-pass G-type receptor 3 n=1 Tax=Cyprinus carpio TaxID=7962 RepID=A0A8C2F1H4_CYPCA
MAALLVDLGSLSPLLFLLLSSLFTVIPGSASGPFCRSLCTHPAPGDAQIASLPDGTVTGALAGGDWKIHPARTLRSRGRESQCLRSCAVGTPSAPLRPEYRNSSAWISEPAAHTGRCHHQPVWSKGGSGEKGVVSRVLSSPVQYGKKRTIQRTRTHSRPQTRLDTDRVIAQSVLDSCRTLDSQPRPNLCPCHPKREFAAAKTPTRPLLKAYSYSNVVSDAKKLCKATADRPLSGPLNVIDLTREGWNGSGITNTRGCSGPCAWQLSLGLGSEASSWLESHRITGCSERHPDWHSSNWHRFNISLRRYAVCGRQARENANTTSSNKNSKVEFVRAKSDRNSSQKSSSALKRTDALDLMPQAAWVGTETRFNDKKAHYNGSTGIRATQLYIGDVPNSDSSATGSPRGHNASYIYLLVKLSFPKRFRDSHIHTRVDSAPAQWTAPISVRELAHSNDFTQSLFLRNWNSNNNNNCAKNRNDNHHHNNSSSDEQNANETKNAPDSEERDFVRGESARYPCSSTRAECGDYDSLTADGGATRPQLKSGKRVSLQAEGVSQQEEQLEAATECGRREGQIEGGVKGEGTGEGDRQPVEGEREESMEWVIAEDTKEEVVLEETNFLREKGQGNGNSQSDRKSDENKEGMRTEQNELKQSLDGVENTQKTLYSEKQKARESDEVQRGEEQEYNEEQTGVPPVGRSRRAANRHPHFPQYNYQVQVAENQPPGTSVITMTAEDPDAGEAGRLSYSMAPLMNSRSMDYFQIDPITGLLTTTHILDREHMDLHYFRVTATDHGSPRLSGTTMVTITVADRNDHSPVFDISAQCVLRVLIITEEMLSSSITVRLQNMSQEHFLSPLLTHFLEGVSAVLSVSPDDVFVFNVQPDADAGKVLNVSFSAALPGGQFFPSEALEEQLYLNRPRLNALVLPFDDNVCLREPCQNYMKCISVLRFNSSAPFIVSPSTLFRPIHPITGLRCRCPAGFTGDYCEIEINLCYSNPCMNGGVCARREGGYTCICREDYTGERCEFDRRGGQCVAGICHNGGTCRELSGGGFRCECPAGGYEKPYCSVTTRSFPPKSFMMFRGLRQRFHLSISLSFATLESNGLLFYNGRFNEKHDFLALEILDGQMVLKYSTGESSTQVSPYLPAGVSDGNWHTVHIHYYNKPKRSVSGDVQGPSDEKVAVLSVDDCDTAVSLRFGAQLGNYSCAAQGRQTSSKKSLDLTGPLFLGGVPNLPENFPFSTREFIGCMKDLHIDNRPVDMAGFIANNGTLPGCSAKLPFCKSNPCQNGGTCRESWETYSCDCPVGFGGKDCSLVMSHPHRFLGNSALWWDLKNEVTITTPWYMGLVFRTRSKEGVLLQAQAGQYTNLIFQVVSGQLVFSVARGSTRPVRLRLDQVQVCDGRWHDLQLELRDVRSGRETRYIATVRLDFGLYQGTVIVGNEINGVKVKHLHVGGVLGSGEVQNGIRGCIQGVRLGVRPDSPALPRPTRSIKVETGCNVGNPCNSYLCPARSQCTDEWDRHTCVCEPGFYGKSCMDACQLNPCENQAKCHRKPSSSHGYICDCEDNHYGQVEQQCPRGWWGSPTCGPCHCETSKGFDTDCNKTTGHCHCKEFHYRQRGSDSCLPCDCYPVGSSSRSCDPESGQCQCQPGVIGRQCNMCDNPFAEVTQTGCEVIYDGCPKTITSAIWWPRTKFNLPAAVPCPKGSVGEFHLFLEGTAIRHCDGERGWLDPDLYNCTSPPFVELNTALEALERNETELNTIIEKKLAHQLRDVTEATTRLYGNDVQIAERLLSRLLTFESLQSGFGLTATQDAHFNENVLRGCSVLLSPGSAALWRGQSSGQTGAAGLADLLEQYARILAQNMKQTYLNPVALVAPNIVMTLDRVDNHTHVRRRFPRYHSTLFRGQALWDAHTHVVLPPTALVPQPPSPAGPVNLLANQTLEATTARRSLSLQEAPVSIVILLIYRSLGAALPSKYHTDRRGVRLPRHPVLNSPVVSVSVYNNQTFVEGFLDTPVLLEFLLLETSNRSKPLCVQWNHTGGCWTVRDCSVVYRNTSHVRCQCHRLGTFGVLMDSSQREQLEGDLETLAIVTYSSLSVSMVALLLTVVVLSCLRGLKSNTRSIHSNMAAATLLSHLTYLLGINQTEQQFLCTVVAILLHYFFMSSFAWLFVEALHIYRMQTEARNINYGAMRFYYAIGWGVPAIITGLAVGLDPEGYGNPDFCWISMYDKLMWSFAGPVSVVILMNGGMFLMVLRMTCNPTQKEIKKLPCVLALRHLFLLCVFEFVIVIFAFFYTVHFDSCAPTLLSQGLAVLLVFTLLNCEVQEAWKLACLGKKSPNEEPPRPPQITGQNPYNSASLLEQSGLHRITLGASTVSSLSSARSPKIWHIFFLRENLLARQTLEHTLGHTGATDLDVAMFHRNGGEDSDSDSDLSLEEERSLSIPSSESEDNVRLRGRIQRRFKRTGHSERLLTEPTHNNLDGNDLLSYWPALEGCEAHSLQKWGSERRLGGDYSKDAANNNQQDAALTSGDENGLTHRHRKGILKNRLGCPPALQGLSAMGRAPSEMSWYRTSTLGHRGVPAASYGRMYSGTGSLSQPASRYSSREQLDSLARRQRSRDNLDLLPRRRELGAEHLGGSRERTQLNTLTRQQASREHLGGALMSSRSREQLESNGGAQPCREWLRTLPPRQLSHPEPHPPSSPPPPITEEPQETLPSRRGRLDSAPPCRYPPSTAAPGAPSSRPPSSEHLDILSSILASFSSTVLTPPPNPVSAPAGPSPSPPPLSATSQSASEVSPDSE